MTYFLLYSVTRRVVLEPRILKMFGILDHTVDKYTKKMFKGYVQYRVDGICCVGTGRVVRIHRL